jgi:hypothetical protein
VRRAHRPRAPEPEDAPESESAAAADPVSGDDVHPAEHVRQVVVGLMTALTAHGHVWTPQQKEMVARALGLLQRWEDEADEDGA